MTTDDLDPTLHDALRFVPTADPTLQDIHVAAALNNIHVSGRQYGRLLATAAAVVVALAGGFFFGRSTSESPTAPIVTAPASSVPKAGLSRCADQFDSDAELVHTYEVNDVDFAIVRAGGQTFILEVARCTYITQFSTPQD